MNYTCFLIGEWPSETLAFNSAQSKMSGFEGIIDTLGNQRKKEKTIITELSDQHDKCQEKNLYKRSLKKSASIC